MIDYYPIHLFLCANLNISPPIPSQAISMHAKNSSDRVYGPVFTLQPRNDCIEFV